LATQPSGSLNENIASPAPARKRCCRPVSDFVYPAASPRGCARARVGKFSDFSPSSIWQHRHFRWHCGNPQCPCFRYLSLTAVTGFESPRGRQVFKGLANRPSDFPKFSRINVQECWRRLAVDGGQLSGGTRRLARGRAWVGKKRRNRDFPIDTRALWG